MFAALVCASQTAWVHAQSPRTVLTVQWSSEDFPGTAVRDAAIRKVLLSRADMPIDYYAEYLESDRFPAEDASLALRDYIGRKYRGRRIDLVIAISDVALQFVLRHRGELFPNAPIVFSGVAAPDASIRSASGGITGVVVGPGYADTLELALKLHPSTERVFVVSQTPNRMLERMARAALEAFGRRIEITYITESQRSLSGLIDAVKAASPRSLIFYVRYSQEDPGRVLFPTEAAALVAQASPVPVYVDSDLAIGSGAVGGVVYATQALATRVGEMARQILEGTRAQDIPIEQPTRVPTFDWRQLRRWRISETLLPAGSIVRFRQLSAWDLYKVYIIGALAIVALQSAMIAGLVVQRVRRRRVEEQNRDLAGRLIHAQEAERARIGRDLHDDVCQRLAVLAMMLSGLRHRLSGSTPHPDVEEALTALQECTSTLATDVRNLSHDLHPSVLEHAGLVQVLKAHCEEFARQQKLDVTFSADEGVGPVDDATALCIYRVTQEALTNTGKHAGASTVRVRLTRSADAIELEVVDDGIGFVASDHSGGGLGLRGIDERVRLIRGSVSVESRPGHGTSLLVRIPRAVQEFERVRVS